ncbi:hypothetical protein [Myxococcus stipitatus]|uniref:hypothetical protein n=1 Tax=Myxococcus stipitatus TaxID=83455 RepID=UPI0030D15730
MTDKLNRFFEAVRAPSMKTDEAFWTDFQRKFGFATLTPSERVTPMNAANLCPEVKSRISSSSSISSVIRMAPRKRARTSVRTSSCEGAANSVSELLGSPARGRPSRLVSPRSFPLSRSAMFADYTLIGTRPAPLRARNEDPGRT